MWAPAFPDVELVGAACGLFDALPRWDGAEGPRWRISIGPGVIGVATRDASRAERRLERDQEVRTKTADQLAAYLASEGRFPDVPESTREIFGWSRKSRANMVRALCELDYRPLFIGPRLPAMVTLTYPGDWLTVAPDGKTVKAHFLAFCKRYQRAWGEPLACVWKLEFQRRGAPHFHLLICPPHGRSRAGQSFREWLSSTWASVVDHPDPVHRMRHELAGTGVDFAEGLRCRDPRRLAVYFVKHGSFAAKEYQHCVPEPWQSPGKGPGRFWGYRNLDRVAQVVELDPGHAIAVGRILRRWARAQGTTRQISVPRADTTTGRLRWRSVRRPVRRLADCRGWVSVNDGPAFASAIARYLAAA